jgi:hypothetical protein
MTPDPPIQQQYDAGDDGKHGQQGIGVRDVDLGGELSDRHRDPVFRESMAVAQVLAQSLLD